LKVFAVFNCGTLEQNMSFERLWAPWRLAYVAGQEGTTSLPAPLSWCDGADRDCFLCRAAAKYDPIANADRQLLVVGRGPRTLIVQNRYPYNNGHLLIAPQRHVGELDELNQDEHLECMEQLTRLTTVYRDLVKAEGFNIGLNLGRVAGAGLPGHLHWHLVPRWNGDTNFMPVMACTRVIPQSLDALWELLTEALAK
jgi:ATP adenylyltransferase